MAGETLKAQPQTAPRTATIIGGSIAGLTAGLALLRRGWDVHIFEATQENMANRGAGIIAHQVLFDTLELLGVPNGKSVGVPMRTRQTFARDGSIVATSDIPQMATSWGRIFQLLRQQFPSERYHAGTALVETSQTDKTVVSSFADGRKVTSDLLIAADGIRSTVRQFLEPDAIPQYVGYSAWRGIINERDLSGAEQQELLPNFTFCLPEGEQVLAYPIAGEAGEQEFNELHLGEQQHVDNNNGSDNNGGSGKDTSNSRRLNVVWYRPAASDTTLKEMLTDINGDNNGVSIAPDKIRASVVQAMLNDADQLLSPQHARLMHKLIQPFIQPIYDLTTQSMAHGNIAIIGDAAFTARPHIGVGITKAVEDAMALAHELENDDAVAGSLLRFNDSRCSAGRAWVDRSRELGAYLQAQLMSTAEREYALQHRTTEAIMRETANLDF